MVENVEIFPALHKSILAVAYTDSITHPEDIEVLSNCLQHAFSEILILRNTRAVFPAPDPSLIVILPRNDLSTIENQLHQEIHEHVPYAEMSDLGSQSVSSSHRFSITDISLLFSNGNLTLAPDELSNYRLESQFEVQVNQFIF